MSIDAFGRLRTSNPITLYDANNVGHRNPLIDISGGLPTIIAQAQCY